MAAVYRLKLLFFFLAKWVGCFYLSRIATRKKIRILCYHNFGTSDEVDWHPQLFIHSKTFSRRMQYLKRKGYEVASLRQAVDGLANDASGNANIVITIDDGWYGIMEHAHPILSEMKFPYTVYVTSYYSIADAPVFNLVIPFLFFKSVEGSVDFCELNVPGVGITAISKERTIKETIRKIIEYGEKKDARIRQQLVDGVAKILGVDINDITRRKLFYVMTPEELKSLSEQGVDLQLHTHRHRWPDNKGDAFEELKLNRKLLFSVQSNETEHFCYPSGYYTKRQFPYLKEAGIKSAVTCKPGLNHKDTNKYELRRFLDGENISQIEFEAEITGFSDLIRTLRKKIS